MFFIVFAVSTYDISEPLVFTPVLRPAPPVLFSILLWQETGGVVLGLPLPFPPAGWQWFVRSAFATICPTFQASCKARTKKAWGEKEATLSALEWLGFWFWNQGPVFLLLELSNNLFFLEQKPLGQNHLVENISRGRIAEFKVLVQGIEKYVREKVIGFHWC